MNRRLLVGAVGVLAVVGAVTWWTHRDSGTEPSVPPSTADNDLRQEEETARAALSDRPNDPQARLRLARALRRLGHGNEAERELIQAIQLGLSEPEGQREYVLLLSTRNWPAKFEGLFQRVVRDNPDDQEVLVAVANSYFAKGQWAQAEPLYTRLLARDPEQSEWLFKRGVVRMRLAYHAKAVDDFRKVLNGDPNHYEARLFLAHSLLGDARMAEAERELEVCRKQRPNDVEPLVGLAACAFERNDLNSAETILGQAAELTPDSPLVLQELATLYIRQQRIELAIETLKRLVALHPNHRQGHLQLAQAYLTAGNVEEARRHEQIYKELDQQEEARLAAQRGMR